jgi:hypothetical protein
MIRERKQNVHGRVPLDCFKSLICMDWGMVSELPLPGQRSGRDHAFDEKAFAIAGVCHDSMVAALGCGVF